MASARSEWQVVRRFLRILTQLPKPPTTPAQLHTAHLEAWHRHRITQTGDKRAGTELRALGALFTTDAFRNHIGADPMDYLQRWTRTSDPAPTTGYSDRELQSLITAARTDAAGLRDRIRAGNQLLEQFHRDPQVLDPTRLRQAEQLARITGDGDVPWPGGEFGDAQRRRRELAGQLFMTIDDIAPLLVLGVALTRRNVETLKELPAQHRVLDGRAVEVQLTKRRRGQGHWQETVTWEIGRPGRELHTAGGFYLLLLELTRRSREFHPSPMLWWIWRQASASGGRGLDEHRGLFDRQLNALPPSATWVARHRLTADPSTEGDGAQSGPELVPLQLHYTRLRTSIEVRRTRQVGGHLPSAARSNTVPVLFRNYLRGDPSVVDWAHEVVSEALVDVEQSALRAHHRAMEASGAPTIVTDGSAEQNAERARGTARVPQRRSHRRQPDRLDRRARQH